MAVNRPTAGDSRPPWRTAPRAVSWFWQHQREAGLLWAGLFAVTVAVPVSTHSWRAGLWGATAISIILGACYLAAAAGRIRPLRSTFAGVATIVFAAVWSLDPGGGWIAVAGWGLSLAVMLAAVIFAIKILDEDRH